MIRKKKRYILVKTDTEVSDLAIEIRKKMKLDYGDERFKLYKIFRNINKKNEIIIPIISSGTIKKIKRHLESYKNIKIN